MLIRKIKTGEGKLVENIYKGLYQTLFWEQKKLSLKSILVSYWFWIALFVGWICVHKTTQLSFIACGLLTTIFMIAVIGIRLQFFWSFLEKTTYHTPATLAVIEDYFRKDGREFYVAEDSGKIVGAVGFCEFGNEPKTAELKHFFVEEDYQKMGIGSRLFNLALHEMKIQGYKTVKLESNDSFTKAMKFYKKQGFKLDDWWLMTRFLPYTINHVDLSLKLH